MIPQKGTSPFGVVERKEGYWAQTAGMVRRSKMAGGGGAGESIPSFLELVRSRDLIFDLCVSSTLRFIGAMGRPTNLVGSLDPDAPSRPYGVRGGGELGAEDSVRSFPPFQLLLFTHPSLRTSKLTFFSNSSLVSSSCTEPQPLPPPRSLLLPSLRSSGGLCRSLSSQRSELERS